MVVDIDPGPECFSAGDMHIQLFTAVFMRFGKSGGTLLVVIKLLDNRRISQTIDFTINLVITVARLKHTGVITNLVELSCNPTMAYKLAVCAEKLMHGVSTLHQSTVNE